MAATRVAINGFGRIGRLALRALVESKRKDIKVIAINDLGPVATNAHLLKHDSIHGEFPGKVKTFKNAIDVGAGKIQVFAERNPLDLPWKELKIDVVLECTGFFTKREDAAMHIKAGAKRVLVSAPAAGADLTVVYGVNDKKLRKKHKVISNASCTTNCLAPVAQTLNNSIGIAQGFMTTIHAYTADQRVQDTLHGDLRRARSAASSIIPSSTGAAKAVGLVLPELAGKLDGTAMRVPVINVSVVDLKFNSKKPTDVESVNAALIKASKGPLKGILKVTNEPLVSTDFNHTMASSTIDLSQTQVVGNKFVRIMSWYDNEWGFANRMLDTASAIGKLG
ncbi:MAG: type I glyceraldehyde-3-phosphate dehydrogenase [Alphaproteobacteria bacterium]|jgi:glyceraldehyde 3-phosphate dehydrogenase|nr:type I glyceraldehyde-3-phosphate dehydrogenase [Alphaproteobacteria bacterium]MBT4710100.1 type I glyceraldehyde-3-phosphate dehydrogenase [Alphaproteobacteria bacterium]